MQQCSGNKIIGKLMQTLQSGVILNILSMRGLFFIVCLFHLGCGDTKTNFYDADFYGNSIKIPEFFQYNNDKEYLKYYCENDLPLKDSLGATFFYSRLCRNQLMDFDFDFEIDFEILKATVEATSKQMKLEIPEIEILSVNSINKGDYFLYEIIHTIDNQYHKNKYSKITYIVFGSHFFYIFYETDIGNTEVIKKLDKLTEQFKRKKLIKNIVLPENTENCTYCGNILFQ